VKCFCSLSLKDAGIVSDLENRRLHLLAEMCEEKKT
jgi:hypothetical protein